MQPITDTKPAPSARDRRGEGRRRLVSALLVAFAAVDAVLIYEAMTK